MNSSQATSTTRGDATRKLIVIVVLSILGFSLIWLLLRAAGGAHVEDISAEYGRRQGRYSSDSVNGTAVLAEMFKKRGFEVLTWRKLSPKLKKMNTIVWFPDDMQPPTKEQREWLEAWLTEDYNRTLIYVGRDYDAETTYWAKVLPNAPQDEQAKIKQRLNEAKQRHQALRAGMPQKQDAGWFVTRANTTKRTVTSLGGPWSSHVDASQTWIELDGILDTPKDTDLESDVLLESNGDPLVFQIREKYLYDGGDGKIIIVANGSFLLNLALVNREHRKLAGLLIDQCDGGPNVAFIESGTSASLQVREVDYDAKKQAWYRLLTEWPINAVILHIAAAGIVVCFAMFPIFGRPHTADDDDATDFGKHIDALGKLLAKTQDSEYALSRLAHYEEKVKRDSGASHGD